MRIVTIFLCSVTIVGCTAIERDSEYWTSSVTRYVDSNFSRTLDQLLKRIEKGDQAAWREFAGFANQVDGESGQTYAVACAELLRRDPTFYLRRHLAGDPNAVLCGRRAYRWAGTRGRSLLDDIYAGRIYIETEESTRRKIEEFVSATAQ